MVGGTDDRALGDRIVRGEHSRTYGNSSTLPCVRRCSM